MNGLQNMAGSPATIDIDGRTYTLSPLTLQALGQVERQVIARRLSPLDALADCIDRFTPEQQRLLIERSVEATSRLSQSATQDEIAAFLAGYEGICYFFYLAATDAHPEIDSPEAAARRIDRLGPLDILRVAAALSNVAGLDALGATVKKSPPPAAENSTSTGGTKDQSPGTISLSGSPSDSAGRPSRSAD